MKARRERGRGQAVKLTRARPEARDATLVTIAGPRRFGLVFRNIAVSLRPGVNAAAMVVRRAARPVPRTGAASTAKSQRRGTEDKRGGKQKREITFHA